VIAVSACPRPFSGDKDVLSSYLSLAEASLLEIVQGPLWVRCAIAASRTPFFLSDCKMLLGYEQEKTHDRAGDPLTTSDETYQLQECQLVSVCQLPLTLPASPNAVSLIARLFIVSQDLLCFVFNVVDICCLCSQAIHEQLHSFCSNISRAVPSV
jgi:hypothetical protein